MTESDFPIYIFWICETDSLPFPQGNLSFHNDDHRDFSWMAEMSDDHDHRDILPPTTFCEGNMVDNFPTN